MPEWIGKKLAKIRQQIQRSKSESSEETDSSESDEENPNQKIVDMSKCDLIFGVFIGQTYL